MKKLVVVPSLLILVIVLAVAVPVVVSQSSPVAPANGWFWIANRTAAEVFSGQYDGAIVVLEGKIGQQYEPLPWKRFSFTDSTGEITVNFYDAVPTEVIPRNTTVRVIGEADQGEVDVAGLQTLATTAAEPNATVAQINAGDRDEQEVAVKGQIGAKDNSFPPEWNYYGFSDGTGTIPVDLVDELTADRIPQNRTLLIYGKAENRSGDREIDAGLMLLAAAGGPPSYDYKTLLPLVLR